MVSGASVGSDSEASRRSGSGQMDQKDFPADKGLYRTAGGKGGAQSRACVTFNRQARRPGSCHGDTHVSSTSSQRTWPGRTDMACGPESRPGGETKHWVVRALLDSRDEGGSVTGFRTVYSASEILAGRLGTQISILDVPSNVLARLCI